MNMYQIADDRIGVVMKEGEELPALPCGYVWESDSDNRVVHKRIDGPLVATAKKKEPTVG